MKNQTQEKLEMKEETELCTSQIGKECRDFRLFGKTPITITERKCTGKEIVREITITSSTGSPPLNGQDAFLFLRQLPVVEKTDDREP